MSPTIFVTKNFYIRNSIILTFKIKKSIQYKSTNILHITSIFN
ncbi:hypothetical protein A1OE_1216 [Candidatus Endolissoclinum faulkneri L2]|uniref:Uncharacterized protein n=1 Tax=Candidatus Endolissoclinum faulkneri L2 TaxID=1193729 RepID=K7YPE4_9PROT|nr:hypothetical protein A1OE_1216 [Candidatus Endolissoclinum faulkneri L2]